MSKHDKEAALIATVSLGVFFLLVAAFAKFPDYAQPIAAVVMLVLIWLGVFFLVRRP